ncbi:MAG: GNAT family N-acetyltransferase [Candidatus Thorarchaeota archaeon]
MKIKVREATEDDCKFLFDLRNHPIVRNASFNTEEISFSHHQDWFHKKINDPNTTIFIGLSASNEKIGMVRFQKEDDSAFVSIAILPIHHNQGYGTSILKETCSSFFLSEKSVNEVVAEIKNTNTPSLKMFDKAGFVQTASKNENSIMRLYRRLDSYEIGVKIFTTNKESFRKLRELHEKGVIDYIELYIVPEVVDTDSLSVLKDLPIIFHAPNINHGFNLRDKDRIFDSSLNTIRNISNYLKVNTIIFHPGLESGKRDIKMIKETLLELKQDYDVILENMPKKPVRGQRNIIASNYEEFREITTDIELKICVDIGHTICSANYYGENPLEYLQKFINLRPFMIHIGDGDYSSQADIHKSLLEGNFPLIEILSLIHPNSRITLETPKSDFILLSEDLMNLQILKNLIRASQR